MATWKAQHVGFPLIRPVKCSRFTLSISTTTHSLSAYLTTSGEHSIFKTSHARYSIRNLLPVEEYWSLDNTASYLTLFPASISLPREPHTGLVALYHSCLPQIQPLPAVPDSATFPVRKYLRLCLAKIFYEGHRRVLREIYAGKEMQEDFWGAHQ